MGCIAREIPLTLWPQRNSRPGLLAAHRNLALLVASPLLLALLSGAVLAFPEGSRQLLSNVFSGGAPMPAAPKAREGKVHWHLALQAAVQHYPSSIPRVVAWPAQAGAPALIRVRQPGEWHPNGRTAIYIDPANTSVLEVRDALAEPLGIRIANSAYPLHIATVMQPWFRWLVLAAAIGATLVMGYGVVAWTRRPRKAPVLRSPDDDLRLRRKA